MPDHGKTRGSTTGRPIMVLLDVLGKRWTLRIMWELRDGPLTFRNLQERCDDVSPTTLNNRLQELRKMAIIDHQEGGYCYTALGTELGEQMIALDQWSARWAEAIND
jgi:DNA-binding HxlR family transcriptional regulator